MTHLFFLQLDSLETAQDVAAMQMEDEQILLLLIITGGLLVVSLILLLIILIRNGRKRKRLAAAQKAAEAALLAAQETQEKWAPKPEQKKTEPVAEKKTEPAPVIEKKSEIPPVPVPEKKIEPAPQEKTEIPPVETKTEPVPVIKTEEKIVEQVPVAQKEISVPPLKKEKTEAEMRKEFDDALKQTRSREENLRLLRERLNEINKGKEGEKPVEERFAQKTESETPPPAEEGLNTPEETHEISAEKTTVEIVEVPVIIPSETEPPVEIAEPEPLREETPQVIAPMDSIHSDKQAALENAQTEETEPPVIVAEQEQEPVYDEAPQVTAPMDSIHSDKQAALENAQLEEEEEKTTEETADTEKNLPKLDGAKTFTDWLAEINRKKK